MSSKTILIYYQSLSINTYSLEHPHWCLPQRYRRGLQKRAFFLVAEVFHVAPVDGIAKFLSRPYCSVFCQPPFLPILAMCIWLLPVHIKWMFDHKVAICPDPRCLWNFPRECRVFLAFFSGHRCNWCWAQGQNMDIGLKTIGLALAVPHMETGVKCS